MYIADKAVDEVTLSPTAMQGEKDRYAYIRGAINELLERWDDLIEAHNLQPRFTILPEGLTDQENDRAVPKP